MGRPVQVQVLSPAQKSGRSASDAPAAFMSPRTGLEQIRDVEITNHGLRDKMSLVFDKIIIGAGLYGLYAALFCGRKGEKVLVLEKEPEAFLRASYVNQARVHLGYHYPRSLSTAVSTVKYFDRFVKEFPECIKSDFRQIYATSTKFSWTQAEQFERFSSAAGVPCRRAAEQEFFRPGMCDGAFETGEVTFDAEILKEKLLKQISEFPQVQICYNSGVKRIERNGTRYKVSTDKENFESGFVLNATYAGVNEICRIAGFEPFRIKYELCEVILCSVNERMKNLGITVMDGPFFSIMPFGKTGLHSLTTVTFTPHKTSFEETAVFSCQGKTENCRPNDLRNCSACPAKPESSWNYMAQLARKYLRDDYKFEYVNSLYSMKPILLASDVDDSRPTCIRVHSEAPYMVSVLSGKITTVYDLEEVL